MKSLKFFRFVSHHKAICTFLFAFLPISICAVALAIIEVGTLAYLIESSPVACLIIIFLFVFLSTLFCQSCTNLLIMEANKELQENCDPYPLLRETTEALKYEKNGVNRQIYLIDYCVVMGSLGEHEFAYQQLSEINIDKYTGMPLLIKVIYYNNLGYYCRLIGKNESADLLHQKALAIYNTLKEGKQKENLKFTMLSAQASACLGNKDFAGALNYANQMKPDNNYAEIETAWLFSEIYLAQNDTLSAKKYLEKVASSNPSLYIVKEAKRLLSEIE